MALWSGPGATPSPRSPRLCTWVLRSPALGPTLKHPLGTTKVRPGRFWRSQRGVRLGVGGSTHQIHSKYRLNTHNAPHVRTKRASSVAGWHNARSRSGVIWCRTALWGCPTPAPSPWSSGFCTWARRWPVLESTLRSPLGGSRQRPGRFRCSQGAVMLLDPSAMNIGADNQTLIRQQHSGMVRRHQLVLKLTPVSHNGAMLVPKQWYATPLVQCRYPALQSF